MTAPTRAAGEVMARRRHPTARTPRPAPRLPGNFMWLLGVIVGLNLFGLVMILSASSVVAIDETGSSWYYVSKQALWALVGGGVLLFTMRVDYHWWRRLAVPGLVLSFVLLLLVLLPGVGRTVNGSTRWLGGGPLTMQPSEFTKLALLVFTADLLARRAARMHDAKATLHPLLLLLALSGLLVMLQPNLGTTIVIASIVVGILFVAGTPLRSLVSWSLFGGAIASLMALGEGYRRARILAFLDPLADPQGTGYQNVQSLVSLASGGITGSGLGASRAKWGFLPFAHTDFIYAIVGEELGLIGTVGVVAAFAILGICGIRAAHRAPDRFGTLLAAGVTAWFLVQAFVNIGAVIGILPITGVPLPFISFGGSSLLFGAAAAGILLNVARQGRTTKPRRLATR
jgi:cell division protein FtsW